MGKRDDAHVRRLSTWIERHVHSVDMVHTRQSPRNVFARVLGSVGSARSSFLTGHLKPIPVTAVPLGR